jgi:hypothetical protein
MKAKKFNAAEAQELLEKYETVLTEILETNSVSLIKEMVCDALEKPFEKKSLDLDDDLVSADEDPLLGLFYNDTDNN